MIVRVKGKRTDGNRLQVVVFDTEQRKYAIEGTYTVGNAGKSNITIRAVNNKEVSELIEQLKSEGFVEVAHY